MVAPPPIRGSMGESCAMVAKRLKKLSSGPKTILGRKTDAFGKAANSAASPAALLRA